MHPIYLKLDRGKQGWQHYFVITTYVYHHLFAGLMGVGGGRFNELRGDKRGMQRAGSSVG